MSNHCALKVMEKFFNKKYKLATSENFDEFMKAIGVGLVLRKIGGAVSPVVELHKEGEDYVLSSSSTFKNLVTRFKPGVEMDDVTPDGRKIKTKFTFKGSTLLEEQVCPGGRQVLIERIFADDQIKMVLKVDDVISTRIYKYISG